MKRRVNHFLGRAWMGIPALLIIVAVASCGGGGGVVGSGGTGSPLSMTVGTVNGFGSVIVDGVSFDSRNAAVVREVAPGRDELAEVKLGDRVAVEHATGGVANLVRVEAALAGTVEAVLPDGRIAMLGQTVVVNASGSAGPITQFGGYSNGSGVRAGDAVEVHGVLVLQADTYQVQATRIDKLATTPDFPRVSGVVSKLGAGGAQTLALGALTVATDGAIVLPSGTVLTNGQVVTVLAQPGTLRPLTGSTWRLQAAQIRVRELQEGGTDDSVSGAVSNLDSAAKTLLLGGLRVDYASSGVTPVGVALANGQYVLARGSVRPDGSLAATSLTIRDAGSDTEAELRGTVVGFNAASGFFSVRGVVVDPGVAVIQGCPATGLADGLYVEIEGRLGSSGVVARTIQCQDEPGDAEVERKGVAGAVDIEGTSFSLAPERGAAIGVKWTSKTYFGGVTPATLSGKVVEVEGSLVGGVLQATKVKVDD